jgi:hypothetical protein
MLDHNHYPRWIDPVHERPVLSARTESWIGDWAWLIIIVAALAVAVLIR